MDLRKGASAVAAFVLLSAGAGYLALTLYDYNGLKPKIVRAVRDSTGRELQLNGPISLKIGLSPILVVEDVAFQNAPWGSRPQLARIARLETEVALLPLLLKEIRIRRFNLVRPDILIETDPSGRSNFPFKPSTPVDSPPAECADRAAGRGKLPSISFRALEIREGRMVYKSGKSDLVLSIDRFSVRESREGDACEVALKGKFNRRSFKIDGKIGDPAALTDPETASSFVLKASLPGVSVSCTGSIEDLFDLRGISARVIAEGERVREIWEMAGLKGLPDPGAFKASADVTGGREGLRLNDLKIRIGRPPSGECRVNGTIEALFPPGRPPRVKAVLASKVLDLSPYLSKGGEHGAEGETPPSVEEKRKVFSGAALPLDPSAAIDLDLEIGVQRLMLGRLTCHDLALSLALEGGRMSARCSRVGIGGGQMEVRLEISPDGEKRSVHAFLKIEDLDLGLMLKELELKGGVEGRMRAEANVHGSGGSLAEIMAGLDGKTLLVVREGRIDNRYIDMLGADLSSNVFRLLNPFGDESPHTDFDCFVSSFDIRSGLAESRGLVFNGRRMVVIGEGKVDLQKEEIDLSLNPSPKRGIGLQGVGKLSLSIGQLTKPFKLGGTLSNPRLTMDAARTALALGKAVGGVLLLGPVGVAAALAGWDSNEVNPCLSLLEEIEEESLEDERGREDSEGIGGALERAGRALKRVFDR